ncbi:MAG: histidine ammonia-lyase [Chloroflexota bacterium]
MARGTEGAQRSAQAVVLTGGDLTLDDYMRVVAGGALVVLHPDVERRMEQSGALLARYLIEGRRIYGVSTEYGARSAHAVATEQRLRMQRNTLLSHTCGTGPSLPPEIVRGMLLLKAQTLAAGRSGVRPALAALLVAFLNHGITPLVPSQGSVGASGDLVPSAHLGSALLGHGRVLYQGEERAAADALAATGLTPLEPGEKEGLALVNGTVLMTAYAASNVHRALLFLETADVVAAASLQALGGTAAAFDADLVGARPHPGARDCAAHLRALCAGWRAAPHAGATRIHDPYSLRCLPQVHGAARDAVAYARGVVETELNSVCDNPLLFVDEQSDHEEGALSGKVVSGGNFHGHPLAMAMDTLAIAMATVANMGQRRIDHLIGGSPQFGLPAKLSARPDEGFGLLMLNTLAGALVSECKTLAVPAAVDSIPTDEVEDYVSMGPLAGSKARGVLDNLEACLALELLCAAQAFDVSGRRAAASTAAVVAALRRVVPLVEDDRPLDGDIAAARILVGSGAVARVAAHALDGRSPDNAEGW